MLPLPDKQSAFPRHAATIVVRALRQMQRGSLCRAAAFYRSALHRTVARALPFQVWPAYPQRLEPVPELSHTRRHPPGLKQSKRARPHSTRPVREGQRCRPVPASGCRAKQHRRCSPRASRLLAARRQAPQQLETLAYPTPSARRTSARARRDPVLH